MPAAAAPASPPTPFATAAVRWRVWSSLVSRAAPMTSFAAGAGLQEDRGGRGRGRGRRLEDEEENTGRRTGQRRTIKERVHQSGRSRDRKRRGPCRAAGQSQQTAGVTGQRWIERLRQRDVEAGTRNHRVSPARDLRGSGAAVGSPAWLRASSRPGGWSSLAEAFTPPAPPAPPSERPQQATHPRRATAASTRSSWTCRRGTACRAWPCRRSGVHLTGGSSPP